MRTLSTGLCIFALLVIVGVTSYLRHRIPYEVFYYVHHLVFVMFALTIAHTMDNVARRGTKRSQTFMWCSAGAYTRPLLSST